MGSIATKLAQLEELRASAVEALRAATLHTDSENLQRDPPLTAANGWVEWMRSIHDASEALSDLAGRETTTCRKRAVRDAAYAIEVLDSALAVFAQELLAAALTNSETKAA